MHPNSMHTRTGIASTFWTRPPAGAPGRRLGGSTPVYVLTSGQTISGGEKLAYDLQALKRATAVIGEAETGAAHPVQGMRIAHEDGFEWLWWLVAVPGCGR
jgi:C-terminal processing protease CtpA/Prc